MINSTKKNNIARVVTDDQVRSYNITQRATMASKGYALPGESAPADALGAIKGIANGLFDSIKTRDDATPAYPQQAARSEDWAERLVSSIFGDGRGRAANAFLGGAVKAAGNAISSVGETANYIVIAAGILVVLMLLKR